MDKDNLILIEDEGEDEEEEDDEEDDDDEEVYSLEELYLDMDMLPCGCCSCCGCDPDCDGVPLWEGDDH